MSFLEEPAVKESEFVMSKSEVLEFLCYLKRSRIENLVLSRGDMCNLLQPDVTGFIASGFTEDAANRIVSGIYLGNLAPLSVELGVSLEFAENRCVQPNLLLKNRWKEWFPSAVV